jgi:hypothetical protein
VPGSPSSHKQLVAKVDETRNSLVASWTLDDRAANSPGRDDLTY